MTTKPRGRTGGRRGRPPKRRIITTSHEPESPEPPRVNATHLNLPQPSHDTVKPREEQSYKDYFPDLNIKEALLVITIPDNNDASADAVAHREPDHEPSDVNASVQLQNGTESTPINLVQQDNTRSTRVNQDRPLPRVIERIAVITDRGDESGVNSEAEGTSELSFATTEETDDEQRSIGYDDLKKNEALQSTHPIIEHQKEGDSYQALSTRPQPHPALIDTVPPPSTRSRNSIVNDVNVNLLPKPSFHKCVDEDEEQTTSKPDDNAGATEEPATTKGFLRPENHYIRYIEPSESELFATVEYDMDEQDEAWLQMLNEERREENLGEVPNDLFEHIIDQLEKEWFDLIKNLPKPGSDEPMLPEDSACAICDDGECENSNAIVFCDGCNMAVHQDCYGIPYIPEGQWLCRKCMVSPENPVSCLFCPNEGGAFKQTNTNKWGHLLCAIWIPEVGLSNSVYMEPIDNIENIPKSRWKLTCYICRKRQGACIQCDNKHCFVAFHATCARWVRLCMRMKSHSSHYDSVVLKAYCDKHTPRDYREQVDVERNVLAAHAFFSRKRGAQSMPRRRYIDEEFDDLNTLFHQDNEGESEEEESDDEDHRRKKRRKKNHRSINTVDQLLPSSKAARAHQHQYSSGAPIAPEYLLNKLENLKCVRQASHLRKKSQLITSICRYWSLKRESRRGAPLLKRLHLEPWTASSTQHKQNEVEKAQRASTMMALRADLEKVRMLSEQVQKREKQKLDQLRKQKAYMEMILFPVEYIAKPIIEQLMELDKNDLFRYPVTPELASDYRDIIEHPMSFSDICERILAHEYTELKEIEHDLQLIWKNSMTYNKPETPYYRLAQRLEKYANEWMKKAYEDFDGLITTKEAGILAVDINPEIFAYNNHLIPTAEQVAAQKQKEEEERRKEEEEARLAEEKAKQEQRKAEIIARASEARRRTMEQKRIQKEKTRLKKQLAASMRKKRPVAVKNEQVEKENKPHNILRNGSLRKRIDQQNARDRRSRSATRQLQTRSGSSPESADQAKKLRSHNNESNETAPATTVKRRRGSVDGSTSVPKKLSRSLSSDKNNEPLSQENKRSRTVAPGKTTHAKRGRPRKFKANDFVWARVRGFPAHPARVIDVNDDTVPSNVQRKKNDNSQVLVQFFEVPARHQWGWMKQSDLHEFGDSAVDIEMLTQAKRSKRKVRIEEIVRGYRYACKLKGENANAQLNQVF
ncbi:uncharacterized protein BYT42DRAFT_572155 [Radiomyces spectabilis]|uniref:uncharacterized protein n=1 Tax=Radiomyces spectabilis TaxID=64574 RepID=UPI0022202488|nr:uncharacterized protein BYT42DRAFT_572155 [Radiomyces spectabilis]KAI8377909.1 hypothetical protein BYT42DRAFT_572155 [Radiomyces spectabilis]